MVTLRQRLDTGTWEITARFTPSLLGPSRPAWVARRLGSELARLDEQVAEDPLHLTHHERSVHSQNGEDGIIAEIFRRIGETNRCFVEFGASDGSENCTTALMERGWAGLWIEGDPKLAASASIRVGHRPVTVLNAFIDRDNILELIGSARAPTDLDLLVVDVDGNDAHILEAVLGRYRPRVVAAEYNAVMGPRSHWTLPYDADHRWANNWRHGAGLASIGAICRRAGLTLVGCDSQGVNCFFVESRHAAKFTSRSLADHWVPPLYHLPYGHPRVRHPEFSSPPLTEDQAAKISLAAHITHLAERPGRRSVIRARVDNASRITIGESTDNPTRVAHYWTDSKGHWISDEPQRSIQPWRCLPGSSADLIMIVETPTSTGPLNLNIALVQEQVRWLEPHVHVATIDPEPE